MDVPRAAGVADAELARRLQRAGLRATRPRVLVLQLVRELRSHRSADELAAELRARGTPLPRTSVYNVVGTLAERGLLMTAEVGPGRALYEAAEQRHHHFVCRECGKIVDVPCAGGVRRWMEVPRRVGKADEAQIIFRGRCRECLGRTREGQARRRSRR